MLVWTVDWTVHWIVILVVTRWYERFSDVWLKVQFSKSKSSPKIYKKCCRKVTQYPMELPWRIFWDKKVNYFFLPFLTYVWPCWSLKLNGGQTRISGQANFLGVYFNNSSNNLSFIWMWICESFRRSLKPCITTILCLCY